MPHVLNLWSQGEPEYLALGPLLCGETARNRAPPPTRSSCPPLWIPKGLPPMQACLRCRLQPSPQRPQQPAFQQETTAALCPLLPVAPSLAAPPHSARCSSDALRPPLRGSDEKNGSLPARTLPPLLFCRTATARGSYAGTLLQRSPPAAPRL